MKRFLKILTLIPIFLFLVNNLAGANIQAKENGKWNSLNGLKNVQSHVMKNGHIVRLEFNKPVPDWIEPIFYEKSVQIDFPGAFVSPSKKSFSAESSLVAKVLASQFNNKTLRVRFHIKPGVTDIKKRFKLVSQGRFVIIRFEATESFPSFVSLKNKYVEKGKNTSFEIMDADELRKFLSRASEKIKSKKKELPPQPETSSYPAKIKEHQPEQIKSQIKVKRAGIGMVPFVDQIKKAALSNSVEDKKRSQTKKPENKFITKEKSVFSLKDSKPTGKPMELVPSGMKMISMFAVVLGLMFLIFFGFKKYVLKNTAFGGGNKLVSVLGTWFLGPKKNIALVEVAGEVLVLGVSQENITLLSSITSDEKIEEIKNAGNKGKDIMGLNSGRFEDVRGITPSGKEKVVDQFSSYLSKFSKPHEVKEKLIADTKEQILKKIGKLKTARA
tara:strand:- start:1612 stop:2940 length:1329 start_codon:yes stop_codon:yes gene_type:complete